MPTLVFVAGPNGSGKSTIADQDFLRRILQTPEEGPPIRVNPDDVVKHLAKLYPDIERREAEAMAASRADEMLREAIESGQSVIRETVLSTDRLLGQVIAAKRKGYRFVLLFVLLRDPGHNVDRVKQRVGLGGHDVPEARFVNAGTARWRSRPSTRTSPTCC